MDDLLTTIFMFSTILPPKCRMWDWIMLLDMCMWTILWEFRLLSLWWNVWKLFKTYFFPLSDLNWYLIGRDPPCDTSFISNYHFLKAKDLISIIKSSMYFIYTPQSNKGVFLFSSSQNWYQKLYNKHLPSI